jgi:hypothetical protein
MRRLQVRVSRDPVMRVERQSIAARKLVYVILADKRLSYPSGRSRIVYVGTTKRGLNRITASVATRAPEVLGLRGVRSFSVHVLTTRGRQRVRTWHKLERAMLLVFKEEFGSVPFCNSHGSRFVETDEFRYFRRQRILRVIEDLS